MQKQETGREGRFREIRCNGCGRLLRLERGLPLEDFVHVEKTWGYFSEQDGCRVTFDLCEDCMEAWVRAFAIPPERTEMTEIL